MSALNTCRILILAAATLLSASALAQPVLQQRCNVDSLDPAQAEARLNWARKCGLVKNVGNVNAYFDTGNISYAGTPLFDYAENTDTYGRNAYSGISYNFEVNYGFVTSLYSIGAIHQGKDALGYYTWWEDASKKKPRPLYPTFGSEVDITSPTNKQLYPNKDNPNDCNLYSDVAHTKPVTTFFVNGYCESSCYTPDQQVLFSNGYSPILDAVNARREDVMTLAPDATLDQVKLQQNQTYSYTAEIRDSKHPIIELRTQSGGLLKVTAEHPVLQGEGRMLQAHQLKVGDELVQVDGTLDPIVSVEKQEHFGKVYNLRPVTPNLVTNILVAQGFLVGSSAYQNDDVGYINRIILHRSIPRSALPR